MSYLILAQSEVTARALGAWLELLGEKALVSGAAGNLDDSRVLHCCAAPSDPLQLKRAFHVIGSGLSQIIDTQSAGYGLAPVVLVDTVSPDDLNPVGSASGWNRLISLLILAYPEVRWIFGVMPKWRDGEPVQPKGDELERWHHVEQMHSLSALFDTEWDPIFDGSGLRAWVRRKAVCHVNRDGNRVAPWIPQREEWSAAIDDESSYAYLHGYAAFRHGFRCFPVTSFALGEKLFGDEKVRWKLKPCALTLEDFYLGFLDKPDVHLASLGDEGREKAWPALNRTAEQKTLRYFITSGLGRSQGDENVVANRQYRNDLKALGRGASEVPKPIKGIFGLWRDTGLTRALARKGSGRFPPGFAEGFQWPYDQKDGIREGKEGHSAPGLLLLVVDSLLSRAERLCGEVRNVYDAVRGAVLATSAHELLGPKTPGTARLAIELKHQFEVLAECQSGGVQHSIELDDRFAEIRLEMKLLGKWYGIRAREGAMLNGEMSIINTLKAVFRDYGEFDEEEACRRRINILQRWIWLKKNRWNPLVWVFWPVRAYIEFMLGSLSRVAGAIIIWNITLAGIFHGLSRLPGMPEPESGSKSMLATKQAIFSFLGADPPHLDHTLWFLTTVFAAFAGFLHLGLLISLLYSKVSRR